MLPQLQRPHIEDPLKVDVIPNGTIITVDGRNPAIS